MPAVFTIVNPGGETGTNGWSMLDNAGADTILPRQKSPPDPVRTGSHSLSMNGAFAIVGGNANNEMWTDPFDITAGIVGETIEASVWVAQSSTELGRECRIGISLFDNTNTQIGLTEYTPWTNPATAAGGAADVFSEFIVQDIFPAGAVTARIHVAFRKTGSTTAPLMFVDDVSARTVGGGGPGLGQVDTTAVASTPLYSQEGQARTQALVPSALRDDLGEGRATVITSQPAYTDNLASGESEALVLQILRSVASIPRDRFWFGQTRVLLEEIEDP